MSSGQPTEHADAASSAPSHQPSSKADLGMPDPVVALQQPAGNAAMARHLANPQPPASPDAKTRQGPVIGEPAGPPVTVLAASARHLQRTAGNSAFGQLLVRRRSPSPASLQRQPHPAADADAGYRDAVDNGQWTTVAQALDRLPEGEIRTRVRALTPAQATALRAVVQPGPDRVRAAVLDYLFDLAVGAGHWAEVAEHTNGFDAPGITAHLGRLTHDQRIWLYTAALGSMSGPSQARILTPIETSDRDAAWQACVRTATWARAASVLDGFADPDITSRVRALASPQATALRAVVQPGPDRVRAAVLDYLFDLAVGAGHWAEVADHINGFDAGGITAHLGRLTHDQRIWLYTAALGSMSGVSQTRILTPIETSDRDAAFQACVRTATWARGATVLEGFPDPDLNAHATALTPTQRASMLAACPPSARRARLALIGTPTNRYVVPFDRNPQSAPGERIIFRAEYDHPTPALFRLVFTCAGGAFDAAGGPVTKTIAGLESGNTYFVINTGMTTTTPTTMRLEVQLLDGTVMKTENWTFAVKGTVPTTITQAEAETDRPLPSRYSYQLGPDIGTPGHPDYEHQTILERFAAKTCNIHVADLKPAYASANGLTSDAAIVTHFFGGALLNGTFTIDANDKIYDLHGGGMPDKPVFEAALVTMKEITVDLPQTYETRPGVVLANYTVRTILRTDGTKWVRKLRAP